MCTFEAAGARGIVGAAERFPLAPSMAPGRLTPVHAVLVALQREPRAVLQLLALNPASGAAFIIGTSARELWLVELSGRARHLPSGATALGAVHHQYRGKRGSSWRIGTRVQRVRGYGIVRIALTDATAVGMAALAREWAGIETVQG
jgi:hypothetical protein